MAATKRPDLAPGWVDRLVLPHGETDEEQRIRARGGRPFKVKRAAEQTTTALRGSYRGGASRRLDGLLADTPPEVDE